MTPTAARDRARSLSALLKSPADVWLASTVVAWTISLPLLAGSCPCRRSSGSCGGRPPRLRPDRWSGSSRSSGGSPPLRRQLPQPQPDRLPSPLPRRQIQSSSWDLRTRVKKSAHVGERLWSSLLRTLDHSRGTQPRPFGANGRVTERAHARRKPRRRQSAPGPTVCAAGRTGPRRSARDSSASSVLCARRPRG